MPNYTEANYWQVMETRCLPMPDGSIEPFTQNRVIWGAFDFLVMQFDYTEEHLVELAVIDSQETNSELKTSFPNTIAYLENKLVEIHGIER